MKAIKHQEKADEGIKRGRGRKKGGSLGPGGYCICLKCGYKTQHEESVKCTTIKCPVCGAEMIREGLRQQHE